MATATISQPDLEPVVAPAVEDKPKTTDRVVIIACSGDLERTWATYIIATTAAAMGKDTTIFHTFWGLFPLVKDDGHLTGSNWMQKMLSLMNRGGIGHLKLSKMNFGGMGKAMMMHLAAEQHDASPRELQEAALEAGVHLVPCQMTMDMMGLKREDLIEGIEAPAGATTMLAAAEGATALFI